MSKLADYQTIGDSASLTKIGEKAFTIIDIQDSDYTQGTETTPGVKITTTESFEIDGIPMSKFHTTRVAVVQRLSNQNLRRDVNEEKKPLGPVKCVSQTAANGKNFFNLVDA